MASKAKKRVTSKAKETQKRPKDFDAVWTKIEILWERCGRFETILNMLEQRVNQVEDIIFDKHPRAPHP